MAENDQSQHFEYMEHGSTECSCSRLTRETITLARLLVGNFPASLHSAQHAKVAQCAKPDILRGSSWRQVETQRVGQERVQSPTDGEGRAGKLYYAVASSGQPQGAKVSPKRNSFHGSNESADHWVDSPPATSAPGQIKKSGPQGHADPDPKPEDIGLLE